MWRQGRFSCRCIGPGGAVDFRLLTTAIDVGAIEHALEHNLRTMKLSFGGPSPFAKGMRRAKATDHSITDLEEIGRSLDFGADVIVVQGTGSDGHGSSRTIHM